MAKYDATRKGMVVKIKIVATNTAEAMQMMGRAVGVVLVHLCNCSTWVCKFGIPGRPMVHCDKWQAVDARM